MHLSSDKLGKCFGAIARQVRHVAALPKRADGASGQRQCPDRLAGAHGIPQQAKCSQEPQLLGSPDVGHPARGWPFNQFTQASGDLLDRRKL